MKNSIIFIIILALTSCSVLKKTPLKEMGQLDLSLNSSLYFKDSLLSLEFYGEQNALSVYVLKKEGVSLLRQSIVDLNYTLNSDLIFDSRHTDSAFYYYENKYKEDVGFFIKECYHSDKYYTFFRAKNQIDLILVRSDDSHNVEWKCKIAELSDCFADATIYFKDIDNDLIEELFVVSNCSNGSMESTTVKLFKVK